MNTDKLTKKNLLPSWDLTDFYKDIKDSNIQKDLEKAIEQAKEFQDKYKKNLEKLSAEELNNSMIELENISEQSAKPLIYSYLLHAADSSKPEHGALLTKLQELHTQFSEHLTFFDLEWNSLSDKHVEAILKNPVLAKYSHHLSSSRKYKPYQLSEKEEILWQKLGLVGADAWSRLFDEILSKLKFRITLPGETEEKEVSEEEVLALAYHPERETRKTAAFVLTKGLKTQEHVLSYIFNIILQDKQIEDNTRKYSNIKSYRNLSNEIEDWSVENLIKTTEQQTDLVKRFYNLKKKILGLEVLYDYDRYAPIVQESTPVKHWTWEEAKEIVSNAYHEFSEKSGEIVDLFFEKSWIDADVREGKRGGAFSAGTTSSMHPYIMMNFTNNDRDVATLAHELGHGLHQYLSRSVGYLNQDTPLTTAETASVFGEMLVFEKMLQNTKNKQQKLALLISKLDDIFATVFRQICLTRFEEKIHTARREQGELQPKDFDKLWLESNKEMFGDSVEWTDNYASWWLYIPHFIHTPFYCYAYSFGLLLSITLYELYKKSIESNTKEQFVTNYMEVLSKGGSLAPNDLLKIMDIDLNHPDFWANGFKVVEKLLTEAENSL